MAMHGLQEALFEVGLQFVIDRVFVRYSPNDSKSAGGLAPFLTLLEPTAKANLLRDSYY